MQQPTALPNQLELPLTSYTNQTAWTLHGILSFLFFFPLLLGGPEAPAFDRYTQLTPVPSGWSPSASCRPLAGRCTDVARGTGGRAAAPHRSLPPPAPAVSAVKHCRSVARSSARLGDSSARPLGRSVAVGRSASTVCDVSLDACWSPGLYPGRCRAGEDAAGPVQGGEDAAGWCGEGEGV